MPPSSQLRLPLVGAQDDAAPDLPWVPPPPPDTMTFVRTRRARRYILRVRPDGSLRVTVPRGGSLREARAFVARQERWIEGERQRMLAAHAPRHWDDGCEIRLRGEMVRITVTVTPAAVTIAYGERRIRRASTSDVRGVIEKDLRSLARSELEPRLRALAAEHQLEPRRVSIRNQTSRWGSCARNGNIALNFRLVQMPPPIRDYVLLHELMHLREPNHSRRFWRLVEQVCPAFREAERWLRTEGKALF